MSGWALCLTLASGLLCGDCRRYDRAAQRPQVWRGWRLTSRRRLREHVSRSSHNSTQQFRSRVRTQEHRARVQTKLTYDCTAGLLTAPQRWKEPKSPPMLSQTHRGPSTQWDRGGGSATKGNEAGTRATTWTQLVDVTLTWNHVVRESTSMQRPEEANPGTQCRWGGRGRGRGLSGG